MKKSYRLTGKYNNIGTPLNYRIKLIQSDKENEFFSNFSDVSKVLKVSVASVRKKLLGEKVPCLDHIKLEKYYG